MQRFASPRLSLLSLGARLVALMAADAMASLFVYVLLSDGYWQLAAMLGVITLGLNVVFLRRDAYPLRWLSPGLSLMLLLSVYPILFMVYIAFTNYGTGHLLPKVQAIHVLENRQYLPDTGQTYQYTAFRSADGAFALWLQPADGDGFLAFPTGAAPARGIDIGALDENGAPVAITGHERLNRVQTVQSVSALQNLTFGEPPRVVQITGRLGVAAELEQRYVYDAASDSFLDRSAGVAYTADDELGFFTAADGAQLIPGYEVVVGARNFARFFSNTSFREPLLRIFLWTCAYAFLTVFLSFSLGLLIALVFGRNVPFQKVLKALFIIPYAIPGVITVLMWRGLLNPLNGALARTLQSIFGQPVGWPPFFSDPLWVKVGIIVINVWLAYPYFMLVNSGALQAIPGDIYEAAQIDGANAWQRFWRITLPLLLVGVGPLLVASFALNFNSLNTVFLFNDGGPPMVGASTPAGHSDILISYVYRLAFGTGAGQEYGYASAISILIFVMLVMITLFQWRFIRSWEEVGKNA
ncbi:MAG: ABC transporter permease subunit [Anaerolineae bacterium]|nr:ABC transporter permease subunit [Anaerolineae bacterium]